MIGHKVKMLGSVNHILGCNILGGQKTILSCVQGLLWLCAEGSLLVGLCDHR